MSSHTLAFIISLDDKDSREAANKCIDSIYETNSLIEPVVFPAVTQHEAKNYMRYYSLDYTYPIEIPIEDSTTGMFLRPYKTKDINKRIACALSHYKLWEIISNLNTWDHYIILEQDALFINNYDRDYFEDVSDFHFICSLNSPIKATRKSTQYDLALKKAYKEGNKNLKEEYKDELGEEELEDLEVKHFEVPWIDDKRIPQGLPGNSAYLITPQSASSLLSKVNDVGLWPNDALICKQFFDDMLYCAYPYITEVQGNESTTCN